jgi:hypothetical protein
VVVPIEPAQINFADLLTGQTKLSQGWPSIAALSTARRPPLVNDIEVRLFTATR